jgi:pimeloyl-ACP methyl ester carboxylesterase
MTHIIFIAGAGQNKTAWDGVATTLPSDFTVHTFAATDLVSSGADFSMSSCAQGLKAYMTENDTEQAVLCGLSLGAMICTEFAITHPDKVTSLVLCGSQVHPNPFLMSLQNGIMRLLPEKMLGLPPELTKQQLLAILRASASVDFRESVKNIKAPTLVICGAKDKPNLPAANYLAERIPNATLHIIPNAGHQVNINNADELQKVIVDFLNKPPSR